MAENQDNYRMPMSRFQKLESMRGQLANERNSFMAHWRELGDYILPRRARFTVTDGNRGNVRNTNIIDSTATFAARTLSSGMMSGMTSPARPWSRLTTPDPTLAEVGPVKDWLHEVNQRMHTVFIRSNLYQALPTIYSDIGTFGTAAMAVMEDSDTVIRCYPFPIGSYMIANDSKLQVRVFMREFRMTIRQVVEMFAGDPANPDWSNISLSVRRLWDARQYEAWVDVVHAIFPNDYYDGESKLSKRKKYAECYYEKGNNVGKKILRESGYDEFPVLAPRWEVTGEDVYATNCPGMVALGDVKMLQHGMKRSMQALDKLINPPMVGPPELRTQKSSILPGDITYIADRNGTQSFRPAHEIRPDFSAIQVMLEQARYSIRRAYFEDLFLMLGGNPALEGRDITAREIDERHEEKLLALGPVLEQLNQDLLDPLIDRTFAIMLRKNLIPEAPPELQGASLKVEYLSIMSQAQKMVGLAGLERFATFGAQLAQVDPSTLDKWDRDQLMDEYGTMTGVPPRTLVPDEDVAMIRAARAEQEQAAQNAATMAEASKAALNLSKSDTRGDNALTDLMRGVTGMPAEEAPVAA